MLMAQEGGCSINSQKEIMALSKSGMRKLVEGQQRKIGEVEGGRIISTSNNLLELARSKTPG